MFYLPHVTLLTLSWKGCPDLFFSTRCNLPYLTFQVDLSKGGYCNEHRDEYSKILKSLNHVDPLRTVHERI